MPQLLDPPTLAALREQFPICRSRIFLNHAGVGPTSIRSADAVCRFMRDTAEAGRHSFQDWEDRAQRCRERFATLIGADASEIAFIRNTSHGLSLVASGLDWRPGDRVAVASSVEYPSNVYPWLDLARRGAVALDEIEAPEGAVTAETVDRAIRSRTRLVAVSSAQYGAGTVTDLAGIGEVCRSRDVLLCVDGIQTAGALPVDVKAWGVHMLSADSHKWLLGMMGIGGFFVDRSIVRDLHPALVGWRSTTDAWNFDRVHYELRNDALRFEEGSLAYPLIEGFSAALEILLETGIDRVAAHIEALVARLAGGLEELGCHVGPPGRFRRHILTFTHPALSRETLLEGLRQRDVVTSLRRGTVRLSPHLYNSIEEMDRVVDIVRELVGRSGAQRGT